MKTKIQIFLLLFCCLISLQIRAQEVYNLWEGMEKPFYKDNDLTEYEEEAWGTMCIFNITEPTLTVYKAQGENSGKAVVIFPGGGYSLVAAYHEGHDLASVLAGQGITAAVLKYRLPNPKSSDQPHLVPLTDARRALKIIREKADQYGFDSKEVGVMGFSAGSHLATVAGLWKSEDVNENPDFSVLVYGVTNLNKINQDWLEESLYFRKMTDEEIAQNTLLNMVTEATPPAFLVHAYDDDVCHVTESTLYADKLLENNVAVEMHLFPKGGHGFGYGRREDGTDQWLQLCINWIKLK